MPRYYHEHSFHKQTRFIRRFRVFIIIVILLAAAAGGVLYADAFLQRKKAAAPSKPTNESRAVVASSTDVFRTQYFQFQASKNWTFVANESSDKKFVYRYLRETLVQHSLVVYVNNDTESKESASRMLIVKQNEASLQPGDLSEHCKTLLPKDAKNIVQQATFQGATFECTPDDQAYSVILGMAGQDASSLKLKRSDGTTASYTVVYQNLTTNPGTKEIYDIAGSFQAR